MRRRPFGPDCARATRAGALTLACLALANCTTDNKLSRRVDPRYGVAASPRVVEPGEPVPKGGGTYRVGKPYQVAGRTYVPEENQRYRAHGIASWYGEDFHGRLTANGEVYDMEAISAAHPTMPMPSYARVTNLQNGRSLIVRVNDRGPYHADRVIDLSGKAAELLEVKRAGTGRVRVEYVGPAPLEGSDDRRLLATLREGAPAPAPSAVMVAAARPFVPDLPPSLPAARPTMAGPQAAPLRVPEPMPRDVVVDRSGPFAPAERYAGLAEVSAAARPVASAPLAPPPGARGPATAYGAPSAAAPAYAAPRYDGGAGLTSGRGLY